MAILYFKRRGGTYQYQDNMLSTRNVAHALFEIRTWPTPVVFENHELWPIRRAAFPIPFGLAPHSRLMALDSRDTIIEPNE